MRYLSHSFNNPKCYGKQNQRKEPNTLKCISITLDKLAASRGRRSVQTTFHFLKHSFCVGLCEMMNLDITGDARKQNVFTTVYLKRFFSLRQMDLDYTFTQMLQICLSPSKV